ncbi:WSC domain-containing [Hyphodiscus hymeniophilus]|uniref:Peroxidase n=1 Tax=Hyphodiscus hymeniophilus TaxID=353542 RepID=A0A9P6VF40_9HELO|nr:WSC domain-containing [Hyphodiscus hymeniophilus]
MFSKASITLSLLLPLLSKTQAAFFYPDVQTSLLEHLIVDTYGAYWSGFSFAITPCSHYVSGNQTLGRETAAQWLRVAFHDFVTARVEEGTGGMDASLGFETLREEDSGTAFNDSLTFFRPFVNSKVSMADLIAISVSISVGNCGGPQIAARGGRIDATEAGQFGVPAPETDLETTLGYFANAGFNRVDSIALTACGHTLGSVHHGGFPTVVGPEAVSATNTAGGIHFDSTVDLFDPSVVNEYLDGTGNQGGPLVTSFNASSRSDLRLYESDSNATMVTLANQGAGFLNTCKGLLQRMVEVVPKNVKLSDVISPLQVKPVNATLDFDDSGNLVFKGYIRILSSTSSAPSVLTLTTSTSPKPLVLIPESAPGSSVFGVTHFFPFSTPIKPASSFQSFTINGKSLAPHTFPVEASAFVIPSLSSVKSGASTTVDFTVATLSSKGVFKRSALKPSVSVSAPVPQMGTLGPAILGFKDVAVTNVGEKMGYLLWRGSVDVGVLATGNVTVEVISGGVAVDTLLLG